MNPALDNIVNRSAEPLKWLIVAAIAYTLATTIWTFFQTPVSQTASPTGSRVTSGTTESRPQANVNWILSKHLFGEAGAQAPVVEDDEPAKITTLPLELQSVFIADDPKESAAIVAQKGKAGLLYQVGEKLPGNAELVEVASDRVLLRRAGVRETLLFPKSKTQFQAEAIEAEPANNGLQPSQAKNARHTNNGIEYGSGEGDDPIAETSITDDQALDIEDYKERLADDAAGTLDELGIETADGGGYRVGNLAQSTLLRSTGLQSGDVILSVNGRPIGDVQQDRLQLDNILAQGSARIEVQRGSRRFFITAALPKR